MCARYVGLPKDDDTQFVSNYNAGGILHTLRLVDLSGAKGIPCDHSGMTTTTFFGFRKQFAQQQAWQNC